MINKIMGIIISILLTALPKMSKEIRAELIKLLKNLEEKAKQTANPIDDFIVALLLGIVGE